MSTFIAIPCMDMLHTGFFRSVIGMHMIDNVRIGTSCSSLIYDARNALVTQAIDEGHDRILWLDSDMIFDTDIMEKLSADLDAGYDYVSALCFKRKPPFSPCVYKEIGYTAEGQELRPFAHCYEDYPKDQIFEVDASGLGCVMMKTEVVKKVRDKFGLPFSPVIGFGEDLSFCLRAKDLGIKKYCDSRVKIKHIANVAIDENGVCI